MMALVLLSEIERIAPLNEYMGVVTLHRHLIICISCSLPFSTPPATHSTWSWIELLTECRVLPLSVCHQIMRFKDIIHCGTPTVGTVVIASKKWLYY